MKKTARLPVIKVCGVPEHFNLPWLLAIEADAFADFGFRVSWQNMPGGTGAMLDSLAEASTDLALLLTEGLAAAKATGHGALETGLWVGSPLIWGIHASGARPDLSISQLERPRFAVSRLKSGSHLMACLYMQQQGRSYTEAEFIICNNIENAIDALANDKADLFLWEKYTTRPFVKSGKLAAVAYLSALWPAFVAAMPASVSVSISQMIFQALEVVESFAHYLKTMPDAAQLVASRYTLSLTDATAWLSDVDWQPNIPAGPALESATLHLKEIGLYNI